MPCLSDGTTTARSSPIGPALLSPSFFRTSHPCGASSPRRRRTRQDCSPSVLVIAGRSSLSFFSWSRSGYTRRRPSLLTASWSRSALRLRILRCSLTGGLPPRGSLLPPRARRRFRLLVAPLGVFLPRQPSILARRRGAPVLRPAVGLALRVLLYATRGVSCRSPTSSGLSQSGFWSAFSSPILPFGVDSLRHSGAGVAYRRARRGWTWPPRLLCPILFSGLRGCFSDALSRPSLCSAASRSCFWCPCVARLFSPFHGGAWRLVSGLAPSAWRTVSSGRQPPRGGWRSAASSLDCRDSLSLFSLFVASRSAVLGLWLGRFPGVLVTSFSDPGRFCFSLEFLPACFHALASIWFC